MKKYSLGFYYNIHIKEKLLFFASMSMLQMREVQQQASREAQQQNQK